MSYIEKSKWTAEQINFLTEYYEKMTDQEIADMLGRTRKSVRRKRERLGLEKAEGRWPNDRVKVVFHRRHELNKPEASDPVPNSPTNDLPNHP